MSNEGSNRWVDAPLSQIAYFVNGAPFKPSDWKEKGLPIIRIQNLNDNNAEFNYYDGEIDERYYVTNGDILLSWSASLGVYRWNRGKALLNQHIFKVIPKKSIDSNYVFYVCQKAITELQKRVHGSTMKHFKKQEIDATNVSVPPLVEQHGIVEVLDTVDEAIRRTDEVIAKTEELKQGLMQRLLIRGIEHTEFKQTEMGEIPKTWEIKNMGNFIEIEHGFPFQSEFFSQTGPIILTPGNFKLGGGLYFTSDNVKRYSGTFPEKYIFSKDDLVVVMTDLTRECKILGNPAFIPDNDVILHNQRIGKIVFNKPIDKMFLYYTFLSPLVKKHLKSTATGSTVRHTSPSRIKEIEIPLPELNEQKKIGSILHNYDVKIIQEITYRDNIKKHKQGLMQVLLSGKVRVRLDDGGLHRIRDS